MREDSSSQVSETDSSRLTDRVRAFSDRHPLVAKATLGALAAGVAAGIMTHNGEKPVSSMTTQEIDQRIERAHHALQKDEAKAAKRYFYFNTGNFDVRIEATETNLVPLILAKHISPREKISNVMKAPLPHTYFVSTTNEVNVNQNYYKVTIDQKGQPNPNGTFTFQDAIEPRTLAVEEGENELGEFYKMTFSSQDGNPAEVYTYQPNFNSKGLLSRGNRDLIADRIKMLKAFYAEKGQKFPAERASDHSSLPEKRESSKAEMSRTSATPGVGKVWYVDSSLGPKSKICGKRPMLTISLV